MKSNWISYIFIIFIIIVLVYSAFLFKKDESEKTQEEQTAAVHEKNTELKLGIARNRYNKSYY